MTQTADRLLDGGEVAELLNVSASFVREHTRSGAIPHVRMPGGRTVRYRRDSVIEWVKSLEQGGAAVKLRKHRPQLRSAS